MATLVLSAVGTLIGGPIGGAIGALAGRSIDGAIGGSSGREGPRLKELAITTSSYGQPIARHHGRMRAGGTIIWATDLVERSDKSAGKKGQPSLTTYSYTTSFAVALSSRPIGSVGRIWADGNLLRGAGGDLKTSGLLRVHTGHGDQPPDPLIAADKASGCPAFRSLAYVVFEDLALGDFGNRIPALSFEIVADESAVGLADLAAPLGTSAETGGELTKLAGFAMEGGPLSATLASIDMLFPLSCDAAGERLTIATVAEADEDHDAPILPPPIRGWSEDDFGADAGTWRGRESGDRDRLAALRYYDVARDFQPGVQRTSGRVENGRDQTIEFPGALAAGDASNLVDSAAGRGKARRERLQWRIAELDPGFAAGRSVRVPGMSGMWRIEGWEWRSCGVELDLCRKNRPRTSPAIGDPGSWPAPVDARGGPTELFAFEGPATGTFVDQPALFAAASSASEGWSGAALYLDRAGELVDLGRTGRTRTTMGRLSVALGPSNGLHFEQAASLEIETVSPLDTFAPASLMSLALGANRLRVGREIVQFAQVEQLDAKVWRLSGLLRGRGGTEPAALAGHDSGTVAVLFDSALVPLDPAIVPADSATTLAAIGLGDVDPVYTQIDGAGASRRPLCPVHPVVRGNAASGLTLGWTRRARGAWLWPDEVETPMVESAERYRVGLGPLEAPIADWTTDEPSIAISGEVLAPLARTNSGTNLWVRQVGTFAQSDPLLLTTLT